MARDYQAERDAAVNEHDIADDTDYWTMYGDEDDERARIQLWESLNRCEEELAYYTNLIDNVPHYVWHGDMYRRQVADIKAKIKVIEKRLQDTIDLID